MNSARGGPETFLAPIPLGPLQRAGCLMAMPANRAVPRGTYAARKVKGWGRATFRPQGMESGQMQNAEANDARRSKAACF